MGVCEERFKGVGVNPDAVLIRQHQRFTFVA